MWDILSCRGNQITLSTSSQWLCNKHYFKGRTSLVISLACLSSLYTKGTLDIVLVCNIKWSIGHFLSFRTKGIEFIGWASAISCKLIMVWWILIGHALCMLWHSVCRDSTDEQSDDIEEESPTEEWVLWINCHTTCIHTAATTPHSARCSPHHTIPCASHPDVIN